MCETRKDKQVAQLHDSYMMMVVVMTNYEKKNYIHQYITKFLELSLKM
jgi:hypothetical protein